ncbi:MAG: ATP-binding protein [Myxococcota bacterium]
MGARLVISVVALGTALAVEAAGWVGSPTDWHGFYATVAFAFLATIGYGLILGRVTHVKRFAALNIATDIAIVSALVHVSGGSDSPFTFLYILVAVYGAVLFERTGAVIAAVGSATVYGLVLLGEYRGFASGLPSAHESGAALAGIWVIHAGAVVLVAGLSSLLAGELRRTGEALAQRTQDLTRLQTLHQRTVESLMSGLLTTDLEGSITSFNPEAERITGREVGDVLGLDIEAVLPSVRELVIQEADEYEVSRARARTEFLNSHGELRHLGLAAYVLKNEKGTPGGHVVIFQDVSDVVKMETELRLSERLAAIGELSASIAHEIRNPLAAISGSIEMLQAQRNGSVAPEDPEQLMEIVIREVDRLNHLITDFLDYARPQPRRVEPISVVEVVDEVLEMFSTSRPEGVEIVSSTDPTLVALVDPKQFRQVLWNLVLNASQAMPDGGRLEILIEGVAPEADSLAGRGGDRRALETGGKVRWIDVAVSDDGVGIPHEELDRIFDPFFTTKQNGSGLGLAMVHRMVGDHGGVVRIESSVGVGTRIQLRLPAAEASS